MGHQFSSRMCEGQMFAATIIRVQSRDRAEKFARFRDDRTPGTAVLTSLMFFLAGFSGGNRGRTAPSTAIPCVFSAWFGHSGAVHRGERLRDPTFRSDGDSESCPTALVGRPTGMLSRVQRPRPIRRNILCSWIITPRHRKCICVSENPMSSFIVSQRRARGIRAFALRHTFCCRAPRLRGQRGSHALTEPPR